jgi:UrcA family protein
MNARFLLAPVALLCATVSIGSAVSAAAEPLQARTARVSFADLNLGSAAGRAMLERRVHAAADTVCRVNGYTDLGSLRAGEVCFGKAVDQAMSQVRMASSTGIQFAEVQGGTGDR